MKRLATYLAIALAGLFAAGAWGMNARPGKHATGCTINSVGLSGNTFTGGAGSGTTVGAITVPTTGTCAAAVLSLTGADASHFQLSAASPPSNLQTAGSDAPGTYSLNIVATITGATASPKTQAETITGNGITGIGLSSTSFAGGASSGTVIGALSVTELGGTFGGTLSITGADAASFQLSSASLPSNLQTNGTVAAGNYSINLVATQGGIGGSPKTVPFTISGSASNPAGWFLSEAANDFAPYQGTSNDGKLWGSNGTNYHSEYQLKWAHSGGDWVDKNGTSQGTVDYATVTRAQDGSDFSVTGLDIAQLVNEAKTAGVQPEVMLVYSGGGTRNITSRFDPTTGHRPAITVTYTDTSSETLDCLANVSLDVTTVQAVSGGYRSPPFVWISGDGSTALGHATGDYNGNISGFVVDSGGTGYTAGSAAVSYGGGTGATVTPTFAGGALTSGAVGSSRGTAWQLPFGSGNNIALRFAASNPAKTISTATLGFQIQGAAQTGGTATLHVRKVQVPVVTNAIETGVANNVTQDANLGAQAGIVFFCDGSNFAACFTQNAIDWTNGASYDYTGADATKIPLVTGGKFLAPTDAQYAGYPGGNNQFGPKPIVVDSSYNQFGYTPLADGHALRYDVQECYSTVGPAQCGSANIVDVQYFFKTTDTGNQSHAFVDGATIPLRATHNVAPKFSTTAGSKTITVKDVAHGATTGNWVRVPYHLSVGGIVIGGAENDWFKITVTDADHYTFDLPSYPPGGRDYGYSVTSNVATYTLASFPVNVSISSRILISGSANSALNGSWPIASVVPYCGTFGSAASCVTFAVTTANVAATKDNGAVVTIVPGATVSEGGAVATYSFSAAGQAGMTVTLPANGFVPNAGDGNDGYTQYSQRASLTCGGVTVGPFWAYAAHNLTTNTFTINGGTSTGACSTQINSGNVRLEYASGNPEPTGKLPTEIYVRWYQLLGSDFYFADNFGPINGGKWGPGPMHRTTYDGNGGACGSTQGSLLGRAGWSARNQWKVGSHPNDPLYKAMAMGSYQYSSVDCQFDYMFSPGAVIMQRGQWYSIEVHLRLNTNDPTGATPPVADGLVEAWIDGRKVFSKADFLWRGNPPWFSPLASNVSQMFSNGGILAIWDNKYMGGVYQSPTNDMHFFIKNIAIGAQYIGPMKL